jgi:hypothetical protein
MSPQMTASRLSRRAEAEDMAAVGEDRSCGRAQE